MQTSPTALPATKSMYSTELRTLLRLLVAWPSVRPAPLAALPTTISRNAYPVALAHTKMVLYAHHAQPAPTALVTPPQQTTSARKSHQVSFYPTGGRHSLPGCLYNV